MLSYLWDWVDPGFFAPWWLVAGMLAMTVLVLLEIRVHRLRQRAIRAFAASHLVGLLAGNVSTIKRVIKAVLLTSAVGLLFIALARPYLFFDWTDEARSGLDVLLAVDCSKSMLTEDVRPNRIERTKLAISDFADHLPGDRLGLIAFAGDAFLQCPLTLDHDAFLDAVRDLDTDTIPKPGTDIATAIDEATDALRSQPDNMKFLILVSDGEDLEGRVLASAKNAAQSGLKIFTIGVGTAEGDRIPERDESGFLSYHHDQDGAEVISHLDESTLRQIASITGGAYAPLGQAGDGLEQIYDRYIAPLPRQNLEGARQKIHIERFEWPLTAAILFLMWEFLINERTRAPEPSVEVPPRQTRRKRSVSNGVAVSTSVILVLLAGATISPLKASDVGDAQRAYTAGDYDASMQDYEKAAESNPAHAELQFNRGDAAYKAGEYSEAEEAYRKALETPDLNLQEQTYYNLGNTQYLHGAAMQKANSQRTIELWKAALHSYECALKLKPGTDTQHNYDLVKQKLDELLQQKQQQGGNQDSSDSGQGQSSGKGKQGGKNQQPGQNDSNGGDSGNQGGSTSQPDNASGGKNGQPSSAPGSNSNPALQAYSGARSQDLQDPQIRSRQDAENLLDSLKDTERHISARSLKSDGAAQSTPSGKDW